MTTYQAFLSIRIVNNIIAKVKSLFPSGSYGKAIAVLITSTAIGQAILVLSLPILTRLYQPQDMGKLGLFTSFLNLALIASCFRFEIASVAAKTEEDATTLLFICAFLNICTSTLFTAVLAALVTFNHFGFGALPLFISCVAAFLSLIVAALYQMLRYFLLRGDNYSLLGGATVAQNGVRVLGQLFMGFWGAGYLGLIVGELLGKLAGLVRMLKRVIGIIRGSRFEYSPRKVVAVVKKNKDYPLYSLPSALVDTLTFSLPIPLITQEFGIEMAGLYTLVHRVLALPLGLIGTSVADAFHGKSSTYLLNEPHRIKQLFMSSAKRLFWLGLGPMLMVAVLSPTLFGVVFGSKWHDAGLLAAVMVPWTFAQLIVSPLSRVIFVVGGQVKKFIYDFTAIIALVGGIYGSNYLGFSFIKTMMVVSFLGVISYVLYFFILYHLVNRHYLQQ